MHGSQTLGRIGRLAVVGPGGRTMYVLVDADLLGELKKHTWRLVGKRVVRHDRVDGRATTVALTRDVLGLPPRCGFHVVHRNGDRRDYRRANLSISAREVVELVRKLKPLEDAVVEAAICEATAR